MNYFGLSDIGKKRKTNQDCFTVFNANGFVCAVVCDGMGGANGGNIASTIAAVVFEHEMKESLNHYGHKEALSVIDKIINRAVYKANYEIFKRANRDVTLSGMGTTLTAFITDGKNHITANIGDSRIYYIPDIKYCDDIRSISIQKLTKDHSLVQSLIDSGHITEAEASKHPNKNIILRALGVEYTVEPDIIKHELSPGLILLCSDGLSGYFPKDKSYLPILNSDHSINDKVTKLIDYANYNGGNDNITAVLLEI